MGAAQSVAGEEGKVMIKHSLFSTQTPFSSLQEVAPTDQSESTRFRKLNLQVIVTPLQVFLCQFRDGCGFMRAT